MITLTDVISAYSTLEGKIYPNINVWYGPHDSLNSAIQYIENICTQIGRSKVKGITVAVEENGTLVEYWNPTNANIFIKKHDTSIIDPATTTSTPRPNKKMYIRNSSDNIGLEVSGGKIIDSSSSVILAGGNLEMSYIDKITSLYIEGYGTSIDSISSIRIIDNKGGTIPVEETSSAGVFRTTSSLYSLIEENDITFIDIKVTKQVDTTTTTKLSNIVYYGVIKGYMDPNSFCSIPINKLIDRSETKFKPIIGDSVNEFTIPQDGYFSYLIIPVDKVELQYAAFTSGGLTSTYYDSSKPNTPTALDPTPNGAYYSKYTRGGTAPYNKGGSYKGIDYDVYFAYINSGSIPEMINIRAKNK